MSFGPWKKLSLVLFVFACLLSSAALLTGGSQREVGSPRAVPSDLNDFWRGSDIEPLVNRLETESREIYRERKNLAALVGPVSGMAVADVGAGSGFMVEEFAQLVGPEGLVYAVDLNPTMLDTVVENAKKKGLTNVRKVVCPVDSVNLPENSVDIVFICDTYHHFEFPAATMASIHRALRPGGQVVLVDFRRVPGESEAWMLEHVRAGEEVFRQEIIESGFEWVNAHYPPFLTENYVLRFRKAERVH